MTRGTVIGIVVAALVLVGIGGGIWVASRPKTLPVPAAAEPEVTQTEAAAEPIGPAKEFTVVGGNFKFSPATITVSQGDTVRINFKNQGPAMHNLAIDEFDVATNELADEEEEEIEFVADKSGTFDYYCSVGNHRLQGMVGKLVVQ